jgi:diguanylate cyclase (GGDEF)-like protein
MDLSQDALLPILLVTIVANIAIVVVLLASGRVGRSKRVATADTHASGFETTIMSSSYSDRSAADTWPIADPSAASNGHADIDDEPLAAAETPDETPDEAPDEAPAPVTIAPDPVMALAPEPEPVEIGIDALTGLPDATAFHRLVADEDARIARYHRGATIVVFELDGLERLTERLGPDAADRIIPPMADTLRRLARGADHVARLGPGRFATLLPETDEIAAINYVERVRGACELWLESGAIALRLAIGWSGTAGDPSLTEAQRIATDRMYVELRRAARRAEPADDSDQIAS